MQVYLHRADPLGRRSSATFPIRTSPVAAPQDAIVGGTLSSGEPREGGFKVLAPPGASVDGDIVLGDPVLRGPF